MGGFSIYDLMVFVISWLFAAGVAWFVIRTATKTKKVLADLEEIKEMLKQQTRK